MASVKVLESSRNKADVESTIADWLNSQNPSSVDALDKEQRGQNKMLITIIYTA